MLPPVLSAWAAQHSRAKLQKPAKNQVKKIREIDGSYLRLQRFDKFESLNMKCTE
jgi:hypothetical protein